MKRLNPLIHWVRIVGSEKELLQVRAPDGVRLTFDKDVDLVVRFLENARRGFDSEEVVTLFDRHLYSLLESKSWLSSHLPDDDAYLPNALFLQASGEAEGTSALGGRPRIEIVGEGFVADRAHRVAERLSGDSGDRTLAIVCSDVADWNFFREANRERAREGAWTTYAFLDDQRVTLGPVVCFGSTACFECFFLRLQAGLRYKEEAGAISPHLLHEQAFRNDPYLGPLISYLIERHLIGIIGQSEKLYYAESVLQFDYIFLEKNEIPALRVSGCEICSRLATEPPRLVRRII